MKMDGWTFNFPFWGPFSGGFSCCRECTSSPLGSWRLKKNTNHHPSPVLHEAVSEPSEFIGGILMYKYMIFINHIK